MIYSALILVVLLSFGFVVIAKPEKKIGIRLLLAFSGAFLLSITIFELLPKVYFQAENKSIGMYILLGILLQICLEVFSKGAEHGHIHKHSESNSFPWLLFLSLCIHAFLEGLPIENNEKLLYGILVHKLPISIILSIFLINSKLKPHQIGFFVLLFALMTPIGNYVGSHMEFAVAHSMAITALIIGVFLHISTVILFESSDGHTFNIRKLLMIILGIALAYIL